MSDWGNGGYRPIPVNIWNAPNGTYGVVSPRFGSVWNDQNSTPQINGMTIVKGNGYVRYENRVTGFATVVTSEGLRDTITCSKL